MTLGVKIKLDMQKNSGFLVVVAIALFVPTSTCSAVDKASIDVIIDSTAEKYQVDSVLVKSIVQAESNYQHTAVSHKGAMGLMQLMPGTAARYNVNNPFDIEQNIKGGTQYLSFLLRRYHDLPKAIAAYNAGEGNVDKYNGIPPFKETTNYVRKVMQSMGLNVSSVNGSKKTTHIPKQAKPLDKAPEMILVRMPKRLNTEIINEFEGK